MMERIQMAQIAKILLIFFFILPIPFIPDSGRSSYLYLVLNIFIILLAIESGILGTFPSEPSREKNNSPHIPCSTPPATIPENAIALAQQPASIHTPDPSKEKINPAVVRLQAINKCPSRPSLFFIGGTDDEHDDRTISPPHPNDTDKIITDDAVDAPDLGEQELFSRAETFIRNFYLQLKIQREDSWKKIHGLYAKPF